VPEAVETVVVGQREAGRRDHRRLALLADASGASAEQADLAAALGQRVGEAEAAVLLPA
jgi:hypothetical protein